jgi:peptidylprolyl isomerase domain and WD repeat-containing protein 1
MPVPGFNLVFDESSNFILYTTLFGIKVVNIMTNKVQRIIGTGETIRFVNIALYQAAPAKKSLVTIEMAASENPVYKESEVKDPTVFCTAFKRNRFYLLSTREPKSKTTRDIFNEKPTREEQTVAASTQLYQTMGTSCIMHTSFGDIYIKLYPASAPKAVENFISHAKDGYYDKLTFHRVVKNFMIQTGDPIGDGTGGESAFGVPEFEDEFDNALRHDQPYMVSMANSGPNTNRSQFFITTVPCV